MADVAVPFAAASNHGDLSKAKKPYVRVLTDKRREQNRRAQKNYREKLKRKLEDLEDQVASTSTKQNDLNSNSDPIVEQPPVTSKSFPASQKQSSVIDFDSILSAAGDLHVPNTSLTSNFDIAFPPCSPSPTPSRSPGPKGPTYQDEIHAGADPASLWQMPTRPVGGAYTPPPDASSTYMSGSLAAISPNYALQHQKALILRRPPYSPDSSSSSTPTSIGIPSPQINLIRLTSESNLSASIAVGLVLGISSTAYLEDHPSRFPWCTTKLFPNATLSQLQGKDFPHAPQEFRDHFAMIKRPLRPSAVQMFYSHPSYLDCIVFPRFRERVIQASVEGKLDHVEFFLDLMHGGLVCWGSSMPGMTKRKRRRGMHDQVAWSTRSWEARRWFLEKWAWLCGTEEEEEEEGDRDGIWQSSRWWWAVRGELESDEEWSEAEEEENPYMTEARKTRFEVGVRPGQEEARQSSVEDDRAWAEGRAEVKGPEEGSSQYELGGVVYLAGST